MNLRFPHLVLGRRWAGDDERPLVLLVDSVDAIGLCRDDAYERVDRSRAEWELRTHGHSSSWKVSQELRTFAFHLGLESPYSTTNGDRHLLERIGKAIASGELVGVRRRKGTLNATAEPTVEQRRLVAEIASKTHGRLNYGGRQYRLVAGNDLVRVADRDSYEVVAEDDAKHVLDGLAKESVRADLAALFAKAKDKLTPNWRPPLKPNGLVLLRKLRVQQAATRHDDVLSPSQMAKLMAAEQSVTFEVVVLGLDDKPLDGISYAIEAPDGETHEGDLGSAGKTKITSAKKGSAGVSLTWADSGERS